MSNIAIIEKQSDVGTWVKPSGVTIFFNDDQY
jgi:hypothetical protein